MALEEKKEEIKKTAEEFFEKMGFLVEIKDLFVKEETISLKVKSEEPKVLIGKNGHTLNDTQHLLKAILRKKFLDSFFLDMDVDGYKEKKAERLKEIARELADEVAITKKEKFLEPMLSYERRIIHLELAGRPDVDTESVGQEPERKVVIKPKS